MAAMMSNMTGNNQRENVEEKLKSLKDDPELAPIMKEIEEGGPTAMMKWVPLSITFPNNTLIVSPGWRQDYNLHQAWCY